MADINVELDDNSEVKRQREIFEKAIHNPDEAFPEAAEKRKKMTETLQFLVEETDRLYTKDAQGQYPKLDEQTQQDMIHCYQKAIDAVDEYKSKLESIAENYREKREAAEPVADMMGNVEKLMGKDFKVLLSATRHGIKTLPEVIRYARTNIIDIKNQNTAKAGANMSSRIRMKVSDENGKKIEGFFTATNEKEPDSKAEINEVYEKMYQRARGIVKDKKVLDFILSRIIDNLKERKLDNYVDVSDLSDETYTGFTEDILEGKQSPDDRFLKFLKPVSKMNSQRSDEIVIPPGMFRGTGLTQIIGDSLLELYAIKNKYGIMKQGAKMESLVEIDQRNCAMSDVAQLLGMENLIAYSEPMTVKQEGKEDIRGTFMQKAQGDDINGLTMGSVLADPKVKPDCSSATLKKQLADLQILDFICGNVDRHFGNMVYKFEKNCCIGIQGIDNDASFGNIKDGRGVLPKLKDIQVISASAALRVSNLSAAVLKTTLRNYKFSDGEIEAAVTRLKNVQEAIKNNEILTGQDEEWKTLTANMTEKGYLQRIDKLPNHFSGVLQRTLQKEAFKHYKDNFNEFCKLNKPVQAIYRQVMEADRNVWGGSKEFAGVRKACENMMSYYQKFTRRPDLKSLTKMRENMQNALKYAKAYKALKREKIENTKKAQENPQLYNKEDILNDKERKRLKAIEEVLQIENVETGFYAIGMLEKSYIQMRHAEEMKGKSFGDMVGGYLHAMQTNVNFYPEKSDEREKGKAALKAVRELAEFAKKNISGDVNTQIKVAKRIGIIFTYDPELMNKTELAYAYRMDGNNHGSKKTIKSAMDIVTFLNDVHVNEIVKHESLKKKLEQENKNKNVVSAKKEKGKALGR